METQTVLASAMKKVGFNATEATFSVAIAKFRNNGGSKERALALIDAAYELPDESQAAGADKASMNPADVGANGKAKSHPPEGRLISAEPEKNGRDGVGHRAPAEGRITGAPPAREPNKVAISAMIRAKDVAAKAIFTVNGIDIRQFTLGACRSERYRKGREHYVLSIIVGKFKHLPDTTKVGDVMGDEELRTLIPQAEAYANAA